VARSKPRKKRRSIIGRFGRLLLRLTRAAALVVLLAAIWSAGFVGLNCYSGVSSQPSADATVEKDPAEPDGYRREEASTFLTLPEWYIVYNTDEYASALAARPPSAFPYVGSVRQYWRYYGGACAATKGVYPFSAGNHLMLAVIGSSFSIEYAVKGLYENTGGRLAEWISGHDTPEDAYARQTAAEYGTFMHTVPWYAFPFAQKIGGLWTSTPPVGPHMFRKWERRAVLTAEYGIKALYGLLIGFGSETAYGEVDLTIGARLENATPEVFADGVVKKIGEAPNGITVIRIPRYEAFTGRVLSLLRQGVRFRDIAGNDEIVITVLAPAGWSVDNLNAFTVVDERVLTDVTTRRVALRVPVKELHTVVPGIEAGGARVEHLYDY
jgi:hypothetical protein